MVVGNHEDDDGAHGWIGTFAACLPDRMGMVGVYPVQYYFDVAGLVRVVVVAIHDDEDLRG